MRSRTVIKRRILRLAALMMIAGMSGLVPTALADDDDDDDDDERGSSTRIVDFTFGSGTAEFPPFGTATFDFDVESGPNGEAVVGFATLVSAFGVPFAGPATCLRVAGNRAVFEVDNQNPADPRDVVVFVGDFGPAGAMDEFNFHFIVGVADAICPDPASTDRPPIVGDIVVGDNAPPRRGGDDDDEDDDDG